MKHKAQPIKEEFYSAGQRFGWQGGGIGLDIRYFQKLPKDTDYLEVEVLYPPFKGKIRKDKARKLFTKHKSLMRKNGVNLVVLPLGAFEV